MSAPILVRVTRRFAASPERVFDAWLDPDFAGRWLFRTPAGEIIRCEIDARAGGGFDITERRDGVEVAHVGTYEEVARPTRLVFTFGVPLYSPEMTRVEIDIAPLPGGGCELMLRQEMDAKLAEYRERNVRGWTTLLAALDREL